MTRAKIGIVPKNRIGFYYEANQKCRVCGEAITYSDYQCQQVFTQKNLANRHFYHVKCAKKAGYEIG